jgi:hypothetical protein
MKGEASASPFFVDRKIVFWYNSLKERGKAYEKSFDFPSGLPVGSRLPAGLRQDPEYRATA